MPVYPLNGQSIYSAEVWMEATSMSQCLRTCEENACGTQQIMCFILRQMGWEWLATSSNALSLSAVALRRAREPCHRCFFHKLLWVNDIVQKMVHYSFFLLLRKQSMPTILAKCSQGKISIYPTIALRIVAFTKLIFRTLLVNRMCWGICSAYVALRRFCTTCYGGG